MYKIVIINIFFIPFNFISQEDVPIYRIYNCDSKYTEFKDLYDGWSGIFLGKDSCDCQRTGINLPDGVFLFHAKDSILVWKSIKVNGISIHSATYYCDGSLNVEYENINGIVLRKIYNYGLIESIDYFYNSKNCGVSQFFDNKGRLIKVVVYEKCGQ